MNNSTPDSTPAAQVGADPRYDEAVALIRSENRVSVSLLQRRLGLGFARASSILDAMRTAGVIQRKDAGFVLSPPSPAGGQTPAAEEICEDVHAFFGLTYSNFLVLHRAMMEAMPPAWQRQMVDLLEQLDDAFADVEKPSAFKVQAAEDRYVNELSADEMKVAGVTEDFDEDGEGSTYHDANGRELDGGEHVLVPARDPVPHYRDRPGVAAMKAQMRPITPNPEPRHA